MRTENPFSFLDKVDSIRLSVGGLDHWTVDLCVRLRKSSGDQDNKNKHRLACEADAPFSFPHIKKPSDSFLQEAPVTWIMRCQPR